MRAEVCPDTPWVFPSIMPATNVNIRLPRRDRIAMSKFEGAQLEVEVETIAKDSDRKPMAEINHYSRVKWVHKVL